MNKKEITKRKLENLHCIEWYDKNSKQRKTYEEMCLREMIMSCLCYGYNIFTDDYTLKYKEILGEKKFLKICNEQKAYFDNKCKIIENVGTDSEGVTYNSIIESEE